MSNREESPLPWDLPTEHPLHDLIPQILVPYSKNKNYRDLAQQEINGLKALGSDAWKLLGTLAAAGGALSVPDLQYLTGLSDEQVNSLVKTAHRSLQPVGPQESRRYAFADDIRRELQSDQNLAIERYRAAISSWADYWRSRGWRRPGLSR